MNNAPIGTSRSAWVKRNMAAIASMNYLQNVSNPVGRTGVSTPQPLTDILCIRPANDRCVIPFFRYMLTQVRDCTTPVPVLSAMYSMAAEALDLSLNGKDLGLKSDAYLWTPVDQAGVWNGTPVGAGTPDDPRDTLIDPPKGQWVQAYALDVDRIDEACLEELVYLAGIYFYAVGKQVTGKNSSAFTSNRRKALKSFSRTEIIWETYTDYLDDAVLHKIHRCFSIHMAGRIVVLDTCIRNAADIGGIKYTIFSTLLMTLNRFNGLGLIQLVNMMMERFGSEYFEVISSLDVELLRVLDAQAVLETIDVAIRPYVKYIHGSQFIPYKGDIQGIFKAVRYTAERIDARFANYGGGNPDAYIKQAVDDFLARSIGNVASVVPAPMPTGSQGAAGGSGTSGAGPSGGNSSNSQV